MAMGTMAHQGITEGTKEGTKEGTEKGIEEGTEEGTDNLKYIGHIAGTEPVGLASHFAPKPFARF